MREASSAADIVGQNTGERLLAYQCRFCCLFRIGHPPSRKRVEAERKLKRYGCKIGNLHNLTETDVSTRCDK